MIILLINILFILTRSVMAANTTPSNVPPWLTLPPTPSLPTPNTSVHAPINNISLWYALYGPPLAAETTPIILLHGGKISSRWYGHLIPSLSKQFPVIAIDTRAHGRSSDDTSVNLSYALFAEDTVALLDYLGLSKASFIGWSDGANTALQLAISHPERVDKVFAYGANYSPDNVNIPGLQGISFGADLVNRQRSQYEALKWSVGLQADWEGLVSRVGDMQSVEPRWSSEHFARIPVLNEDETGEAPMVLVAAGDHEEVILPEVPGRIHGMIPNSQLAILPGMSHFGPLQDPEMFAAVVKAFLNKSR
ncbi:Alpha/Beta hydrolase protein [Aspergillus multicolor]|uniref:alpha/beta fold hydrolase n=1 Tax=Aspergillus multicolor TaxID=41759 RepID=UPI003CCDDC50